MRQEPRLIEVFGWLITGFIIIAGITVLLGSLSGGW